MHMWLAENLDFVDVFGGEGAVAEGFSPCLNQSSQSPVVNSANAM